MLNNQGVQIKKGEDMVRSMLRNTGLVLAILVCVLPFAQSGEQNTPALPELALEKCAASPVVDGDLSDSCWKSAKPLPPFYLYRGGGKTIDEQTVKVVRDDAWIYFAFDLRLPHPDAIETTVIDHDGGVCADDSIEIFVDPGTDGKLYYHYMLSVDNVRAERSCMPSQKSFRNLGWNVPWRSGTRRTKTGWQAEVGVPLSLMAENGDMSKLRLNVCSNRVLPTLNYMNVAISAIRQNLSWSPVNRTFHEPEHFGKVTGLAGVKPQPPLLVAAQSLKTSSYQVDDKGGFFYAVNGVLTSFADCKDTVKVEVEDKPASGKGETVVLEIPVAQKGQTPFALNVPVKVLDGRTAMLRLCNAKTGEVLESILMRDMADLSLMRSYARYSYYTTEAAAEIVCEVGLPASERAKMKLVAKGADGKQLAEAKTVKARTMLPVPIKNTPNGEITVTVELQGADGKAAVSQNVALIKRAPKPGSEWKIDHGNKTILNNGKPFFPFGVMAMTHDRGDLEMAERAAKDLASMGFNMIVRWERSSFDDMSYLSMLLDLGKKYNFYVVDFPRMCWRYQVPEALQPKAGLTPDEQWEWRWKHVFEPGLKQIKDHPNLMGYYLFDEPQANLEYAAWSLRFHKKIYELDGYHPTEVLYIPPVPEGDTFSNNCDILGIDPYFTPGGGTGETGSPNRIGKAAWIARRRADRDLKLAWVTPCAENWSGIRKRFIDGNEQRVQTYLSLIHGASAVIYFVYPFKLEQTFDAIKQLGDEMKILGPACAAGPVPQNIKYNPVPLDVLNNIFPDVQVALKKNPSGGYILLAANHRAYPVDATYTVSLLGKGGKVTTLFNDGKALPVTEQSFSDSFGAMETRAYAIDGPADLDEPAEIAVNCTAHAEKTNTHYTAVGIGDHGVPGRKNLLRNASFEQASNPGAPDYYRDIRNENVQRGYRLGDKRGDCGWKLDTENPYHGKVSLKMGGGKGIFLLFECVPKVTKETKFVFSAYVRANEDKGMGAMFYGPADERKRHPVTAEWQRISITYTVKPGAEEMLIGLYPTGGDDSRTLWVDAMQFEEGTEPTEFELLEK